MYPLAVDNLSFAYEKNRKILDNVSFNVEKGTVTSILGPNGSGKTTMLKLILGLLVKSEGSIRIYERELEALDLKERAKYIAYVPQKHRSVFAYKVLDVVAMGKLPYSGIFCMNTKQDCIEAEEMLNKMGLGNLSQREFSNLSGGEQQLVMICRAMLQNSKILVLDEPVTGLDYGNQIMLLKKLAELSKTGVTCIMTTHYPEHALWLSDYAIFFKQGKVMASGKCKEVINKENLYDIYNENIDILNTEINGKSVATCIPLI